MEPVSLSKFLPICGIYKITNTKTGGVYIGKSVNVMARWLDHAADLRIGKHCNKALSKDFKKMGAKVFVVEVIEECDPSMLSEREFYYIYAYMRRGLQLYNNQGIKGDSRFNPDCHLTEADLRHLRRRGLIER